jgi:hypothetical protein
MVCNELFMLLSTWSKELVYRFAPLYYFQFVFEEKYLTLYYKLLKNHNKKYGGNN